MDKRAIHDTNRSYWDANADDWFGVTALPQYGVQFVTEDELHFFGDVRGKKLLDIGCGSGHSLKYLADRGAGELWGLDISQRQLDNAEKYLGDHGHAAKLICSAMEEDCGIPVGYFDILYSIYAVGWTVDLNKTFQKFASYLKKGGAFIFSWQHPLHRCVLVEGDDLLFRHSYFDESWFTQPLDGSEIALCGRKISTYVNALAKAGFVIEAMAEQTDEETMSARGDLPDRSKKAQMLPLSFAFKARKA